ncbi:hypothetical protein RFI_19566 [Reticulomyxa filosa]|uniref:Uncharacterized protein n=1 Tax=Reticulomyxa filosa TaxID=46433 RepID=X6MXE3_RETFI|nr:hypothetical protein RFI_19566 [Reticulomyxa filosa]|eukprot:ETO17750.1 hypothetical protein RFI_19566 [Reticulomyxa filosa]
MDGPYSPSAPDPTETVANANVPDEQKTNEPLIKEQKSKKIEHKTREPERPAADEKNVKTEDNLRSTMTETVGGALSTVKKFSNMECIAFFAFLVVFCVMMSLSRGLDDLAYIQTAGNSIRNRLTIEKFADGFNSNYDEQFEDINKVVDIWNYLNQVALKILLTEGTMSQWNDTINVDTLRYYPLGHTRLLGGVRLRQSYVLFFKKKKKLKQHISKKKKKSFFFLKFCDIQTLNE